MASKNQNPYRDGVAYNKIFAFIRKNQVVTRQQLLDQGFSVADVTVVLSPREVGKTREGADCRGNMSAAGHLYFMDKLAKVKGEAQRFRLRWRKTPLDKHVRPPQIQKDSTKSGKVVADVVTPEATEVTTEATA